VPVSEQAPNPAHDLGHRRIDFIAMRRGPVSKAYRRSFLNGDATVACQWLPWHRPEDACIERSLNSLKGNLMIWDGLKLTAVPPAPDRCAQQKPRHARAFKESNTQAAGAKGKPPAGNRDSHDRDRQDSEVDFANACFVCRIRQSRNGEKVLQLMRSALLEESVPAFVAPAAGNESWLIIQTLAARQAKNLVRAAEDQVYGRSSLRFEEAKYQFGRHHREIVEYGLNGNRRANHDRSGHGRNGWKSVRGNRAR
jgi:hypothetical protein